jgi:hypothetical protein
MEILVVTLMGAFDKSTPLGGQQGAVCGGDDRPTEILRGSLPTHGGAVLCAVPDASPRSVWHVYVFSVFPARVFSRSTLP